MSESRANLHRVEDRPHFAAIDLLLAIERKHTGSQRQLAIDDCSVRGHGCQATAQQVGKQAAFGQYRCHAWRIVQRTERTPRLVIRFAAL